MTTPAQPASIVSHQAPDPDKLNQLVGQMLNDVGAAATGPLVILGTKLGLYRKLAETGPVTFEIFAQAANIAPRYALEWLSTQAASGYVTYDAGAETFHLSPEQYAVFADENSPAFFGYGFHSVSDMYNTVPQLEKVFPTGEGIPWGDHTQCLFCGTERFFRTSYQAHLLNEWIPSLDGMVERLKKGATVADVGCGHGVSTLLMARAFPNSKFIGFDIHPPSVKHAQAHADESKLTNVEFRVGTAKDYPGKDYDLVCFFDSLHDMGDPLGGAKHVLSTLKPDGAWMLVEPAAGDSLAENLNPVGRVYYAFSTGVCVPNSLSQEVGAALGAQAGEKRLTNLLNQAGFSRIRKATATPFNIILEAKP